MDDFSMQYEQNGDATVVAISDRVDSASAGTMDLELDKQISANRHMVLDLKRVEFLHLLVCAPSSKR